MDLQVAIAPTKETALSDEELIREILRLKKERNAVILAHYYQYSEIQELADFVGDSLELSRRAQKTDADTIVFCGVHFMAETAKILNPTKKVLLPDLKAGCSLAESAPAEEYRRVREQLRQTYPNHVAITYINCSAEVKALSDIICTSSNAERIIRSVPEDVPILFAPDRNLGAYLQRKTGRQMILWNGTCIVHQSFSVRRIEEQLAEYPDAELIAHPECEDAILERAHFIGSTSALLRYTVESPRTTFIVATEPGIIHQMEKASPHKRFIPALPEQEGCRCSECPYMKLNTLEKLYLCLLRGEPEIHLDPALIERARLPLERMMALSQ
ncbi:MAG: quinolinate synthase NadA [Bacteroidota bacterium]|nr:quinolinate synthase NadA [Candidatus Kapabacteria bacterium]MCS7302883.1 quinolinate synthase NadA [Candidatus Kapabacteria bacterium]MCX7936647.1 quinolinate synthase NadA [Chlorobiota bacterium]MDW8075377.1 quinolinate synthase NadA [Bacteroidota bacterium]MDW8272162.1 quinolinate synthase NadA [Bacteroidota bacterium]